MYLKRGRIVDYRKPRSRVEFRTSARNHLNEIGLTEEDIDHDVIIHVDKMTPQYEEVFYEYLKEIYDEQ